MYALKDSLLKYYPKSFLKTQGIKMFEKLVQFFPLKCLPEWFGYDGYYIPRGIIYIYFNILYILCTLDLKSYNCIFCV